MVAHATPSPDRTPQSALQACVEAGQRAIEEHRWADAIKWLERATEIGPADAALTGNLAFALSRDGQYDRAIQVLYSLCELEPHIARWPYMIGYQHYMRQNWHTAIEWFDKALALRPDYPVVLYRKGYALLQLGDKVGGLRDLGRCTDIWRKLSPDKQQAHSSTYSDACFQIGKAYLNDGLSLKAEKPLTEAVRFDPNDPDKRYELGKCLLKNKAAGPAIAQLQEADRLRAGVDYVLDRLGQAFTAIGDFVQAEAAYHRIPEHRRRPYVLVNYGQLLVQQGRHADALPMLHRTVQKEPDNFRARYLLGVCHEALGESLRARQELERAIEIRQRRWNRPYPEAEEKLQGLASAGSEVRSAQAESVIRGIPTVGTIDTYVVDRGFGFIRSGNGEKIFFHISALREGLQPSVGQQVCYEAIQTEKGLRAQWVSDGRDAHGEA
jgi:tetratricopeptide (TPR) repeat protein